MRLCFRLGTCEDNFEDTGKKSNEGENDPSNLHERESHYDQMKVAVKNVDEKSESNNTAQLLVQCNGPGFWTRRYGSRNASHDSKNNNSIEDVIVVGRVQEIEDSTEKCEQVYDQDNKLTVKHDRKLSVGSAIRQALAKPTEQTTTEPTPLKPFTIFRERRPRTQTESYKLDQIIEQDPAIIQYLQEISSRRGNNGTISNASRTETRCASRAFLEYIGLELTNHAISDLVNLKKQNPSSMVIEQALRPFSNEDKIKTHRKQGSYILGIFRANFTPLTLRIDNHFDPAEENCTLGIFREGFTHLTNEQQAMMQWQLYAPERAKAICKVPLEQIDLTRPDYAIITIQKQDTKARVKHPCLVPIDYAKHIVQAATAAKRNTPFPNYKSQWKKITAFYSQEYKVHMHSHYIRKVFQTIAEQTAMPANHWTFFMGEKLKDGHLPNIYSLAGQVTVFIEQLISEYNTHLTSPLTLPTSSNSNQSPSTKNQAQ